MREFKFLAVIDPNYVILGNLDDTTGLASSSLSFLYNYGDCKSVYFGVVSFFCILEEIDSSLRLFFSGSLSSKYSCDISYF